MYIYMYTCACSSDNILAMLILIVCVFGLPVALIVYCIMKMKNKGLDGEGGTYIQFIEKECLLLFWSHSKPKTCKEEGIPVHVYLWLSVQRPTLQCTLFT